MAHSGGRYGFRGVLSNGRRLVTSRNHGIVRASVADHRVGFPCRLPSARLRIWSISCDTPMGEKAIAMRRRPCSGPSSRSTKILIPLRVRLASTASMSTHRNVTVLLPVKSLITGSTSAWKTRPSSFNSIVGRRRNDQAYRAASRKRIPITVPVVAPAASPRCTRLTTAPISRPTPKGRQAAGGDDFVLPFPRGCDVVVCDERIDAEPK